MLDARRRTLLALGSLALLPACALRRPGPEGRIRDVRERKYIDEEVLLHALRPARYRLLGEIHDNPAHHAIRARLVDALGRAGLKPVVAFEQFDAVRQEPLEEVLEEKNPTAEDVARAVRFDREGWNWEFYRPIVEAALRHGMPLRAANLSRSETMRIAREGPPASLPSWSAEQEALLRRILFEGHCGALPERAVPGMVAAQRARDAQLAEALSQPSPDGAVLIAGNGHVRKDVGVPAYLPAGGVVSLGILEDKPRDAAPYDFVWVTEPAERPDPCEAFGRK